jgi:hypothetical protein
MFGDFSFQCFSLRSTSNYEKTIFVIINCLKKLPVSQKINELAKKRVLRELRRKNSEWIKALDSRQKDRSKVQ